MPQLGVSIAVAEPCPQSAPIESEIMRSTPSGTETASTVELLGIGARFILVEDARFVSCTAWCLIVEIRELLLSPALEIEAPILWSNLYLAYLQVLELDLDVLDHENAPWVEPERSHWTRHGHPDIGDECEYGSYIFTGPADDPETYLTLVPWVGLGNPNIRLALARKLEAWLRAIQRHLLEPSSEGNGSGGPTPSKKHTAHQKRIVEMKKACPTAAEMKAGKSLEWVCVVRSDLVPPPGSKKPYSPAQHKYIVDHGCPAYPDDSRGRSTVPTEFETWARYVRAYLAKTQGPRRSPRAGRDIGASIVCSNEI